MSDSDETRVPLPRDSQSGLGLSLVVGLAGGSVAWAVGNNVGLADPALTLGAVALALCLGFGLWWKRRGPGTGRALRVSEETVVLEDERGVELGRCARGDLAVSPGLHHFNPNALFGSLQPAVELRIPGLPPLLVGAKGMPIARWPKDRDWNAVEFLLDPDQWTAFLAALALEFRADAPDDTAHQ